MKDCYKLNIYTDTFERKENMNQPRRHHGLYKMAQKIFAFGGFQKSDYIKSAEVYDVLQQQWNNLPDMPVEGSMMT